MSPYTPGVLDGYRRYDTTPHRLHSAALGVDFRNLDPATHTDPGLITQRVHLAKRYNGAGIVRVADVCFASFVRCPPQTLGEGPRDKAPAAAGAPGGHL